MKKKLLCVLLTAAMATSMLAGCGGKAESDGKVLNIYCWNEEFKTRITDHYPGYTAVDGTTGTIGDVTVKWNITPNADNAYQNNLDATLANQASAAADDKIDILPIQLLVQRLFSPSTCAKGNALYTLAPLTDKANML